MTRLKPGTRGLIRALRSLNFDEDSLYRKAIAKGIRDIHRVTPRKIVKRNIILVAADKRKAKNLRGII